MKEKALLILLLILSVCTLPCHAKASADADPANTDSVSATAGIRVQTFSEQRVLSTIYAVEIGGEQAFNTYLSPLRQRGTTYALSGRWSRPFASPLWDMDINARVRLGTLHNRANTASMTDLGITLSWQAQRSFAPLPALSLKAGAGIMLDAGMLYLPRNSNNPVAARAWVGATLNGAANYSLRLWGHKINIIDEICLPTLGVFFSPHFGQSYYEISLGETSGLARCGWWGNHFAIDNLLAVEVPVCSTRIRVGYRINALNSRASDIHSRITTHSVVLGIHTDWLNVTRRHE